MGRKKVNQLMQSDNGLIAELADVKWIKQPVIYSMISGDFTLMQMNIIIALSKAIQERIEEYLSRNCKSQGGGKQLTLFRMMKWPGSHHHRPGPVRLGHPERYV